MFCSVKVRDVLGVHDAHVYNVVALLKFIMLLWLFNVEMVECQHLPRMIQG